MRKLTRREEYSIAVVVGAVILFVVLPYRQPSGIRRTIGLSNVKQISTACKMYEDDFDGHLPFKERWMDDLYAYTKNDQIFHDPFGGLKPEEYGYAFRESASGLLASKIRKPEKFVLFFESTDTRRNGSGDLSLLLRPERQEGVQVVGFADGHAKAWAASRLDELVRNDRLAGPL